MKIQDDALVDVLKEIEKGSLERRAQGIVTGFHDLDRITLGFTKGEIITIGARPGMGGTSIILSWMANLLYSNAKKRVLFVTPEPFEQIRIEALGACTRIPISRLRLGKVLEREWVRLAEGADKVSKEEEDFFLVHPWELTPDNNFDIVFVDMFSFSNLLLADLRSKYRNSVLVLVSSVSDRVDHRPNKRPMPSDLFDDLAYISDYVLFLYRDDFYNRQSEDRGIAELIIAKSRRSECDTIRLAFLKEYKLFANLGKTE